MSESKTNVRTQHLSGNRSTFKNKNFFELTDSIPRALIKKEEHDYDYQWYLKYAELLIKVCEKYDVLKYIEVDFKESDSILWLTYQLETRIQLIEGWSQEFDTIGSHSHDDDNDAISIYSDSTSKGSLKSITLGFPDIQPDYIYAFFLSDITKFRSREMRVGYAYFINHFKELLSTLITDDPMSYYESLERELDDCELYWEKDEPEEGSWEHSVIEMKKLLDRKKGVFNKTLKKFNDYSTEYYSVFQNYKPRSEEMKKLHSAITYCVESLKDFHSNYNYSSYGMDAGLIMFEDLFRVFPYSDEASDYEIDYINNNGREGVMSLESLLKISKSKIDEKSRKDSQILFKKLCENMIIISEFFNKKENAKEE